MTVGLVAIIGSMIELKLLADFAEALFPLTLCASGSASVPQSFLTISRCGTKGHFALGFLWAHRVSATPVARREQRCGLAEFLLGLSLHPTRPKAFGFGAAQSVGCVSRRVRFHMAMRICRTVGIARSCCRGRCLPAWH